MLKSDVAEMAPIRAIEEDMAKSFGHDLPCFETYADIEAERLGIDGHYDEIMEDGRTFMDHYRSDLLADPSRCDCIEWEIVGPNPFAGED